jgi:apolipoprotein N-acyltransferase
MSAHLSSFTRLDSYLLPLLSGIMSASVFLLPSVSFLSLIALIPFFFFVFHARTPQRAAKGGLIYGILGLGASVFWFFDTHPLTWVGVEHPLTSYLFITAVWLLGTLVLSSGPALFAWLMNHFQRNSIRDLFGGTVLFVLTEYLRAFLFSVLWYAPEAAIGPYWTFGFAGIPLADTPLLFYASIGGLAALSLIAVYINMGIVVCLSRTQSFIFRSLILCSIAVVLLTPIFFPPIHTHSRNSSKTLTIGILHTESISEFGSSSHSLADTHRAISSLFSTSTPPLDLLVFPEDSRFLESLSQEERATFLSRYLSPEGRAIDSHTYREANGDLRLVHTLYTAENAVAGTYHKRFLTPFGEYLPVIAATIAETIAPEWHDTFRNRRVYTPDPFDAPVTLGSVQGFPITALFCAEITPPQLYTAGESEGGVLFVNTASHSSFHGSDTLRIFITRQAKIHAVTHGRYFIHAGNSVPSFLVDPSGKIANSTHNTGAELLIVSLPIHDLLTEETP